MTPQEMKNSICACHTRQAGEQRPKEGTGEELYPPDSGESSG
jgi:hypothetical protein